MGRKLREHFTLACDRPAPPQPACRVPLAIARAVSCLDFRVTSLISSNGLERLLAGRPGPRTGNAAAEHRHVRLARRARFVQNFG